MSSETPPEGSGSAAPEAPVVPPQLRRRLQQCYEHAKKLMAQPKYDFDYANTALTECIVGDPSNLEYVNAFFENLNKKYNNNLKGAGMQMFLSRGGLKKALGAKQWTAAIRAGAEILKTNPWDATTLRGMAEACEHLGCSEAETRYLKNAIDGNPKDIDVCRHCAKSLARMGQYDQAIACWARVAEIKRNDPEALKMIGDLQVEKTKWKFGLLTQADKKSRPVAAPPQKKPERGKEQVDEITIKHTTTSPDLEETKPYEEPKKREIQLTPWQKLERAISDDAGNVDNYLQLSDIYAEEGKLPDAERTLQRGLAASGNDLRIRERLEEVHVLRAKQQLKVAEKRLQAEETDVAKELVKQLKETLNRLELDLFNQRAERYPNERKWKYELAVRLKKAANYSEALKRLAEIDPQSDLAAAAQLESGECLQYLKQYQRALDAYRQASELAAKSSDSEHLKLALYRGGVLATAMKDSAAREMLTRLVELDPQFRDAKQRLMKLVGNAG